MWFSRKLLILALLSATANLPAQEPVLMANAKFTVPGQAVKGQTEAKSHTEKAQPKSVVELSAAATALKTGERAKAREILRTILAADPANASAHILMGRLSRLEFQTQQALHHFSEGLALAPNDPILLREYAATTTDSQLEEVLLRRLMEAPATPATWKREAQARLHLLEQLSGRQLNQIASASTHFAIPMPVSYGNDGRPIGWILRVRINDGPLLRLMLDTGSRRILVFPHIARKLGMEHLANEILDGFGEDGKQKGRVALAAKVKIGPDDKGALTVNNVLVDIGADALDGRIDGLIGVDLFQRFLIHLNGPKKMLLLEPFPNESQESLVAERTAPTLLQAGHLLLAPARFNEGPPACFVLDSGASYTLLHPREQLISSRTIRLRGVSGELEAPAVTLLDTVHFPAGFGTKLDDTIAVDLSDISDHFGIRIDGFAGFPMLSRLLTTIDMRRGSLAFSDPRRRR